MQKMISLAAQNFYIFRRLKGYDVCCMYFVDHVWDRFMYSYGIDHRYINQSRPSIPHLHNNISIIHAILTYSALHSGSDGVRIEKGGLTNHDHRSIRHHPKPHVNHLHLHEHEHKQWLCIRLNFVISRGSMRRWIEEENKGEDIRGIRWLWQAHGLERVAYCLVIYLKSTKEIGRFRDGQEALPYYEI